VSCKEIQPGRPFYRDERRDAPQFFAAKRLRLAAQDKRVRSRDFHGTPPDPDLIPLQMIYNQAHGQFIGEKIARMSVPSDMTAFVRAVELGGFSTVAREMGLTPSAISKLVTRLEERLGVRLLNRTTRRLALTPEGEAYFHRSQRILADITEAENEVARFRALPKGILRINVGTAFGLHQLTSALPAFLARHPEMQVELTLTDRVVDLIEEGADLGIRLGTLTDSSLIARKICDLERVVCASPGYLKKHGTPRKPADLLQHNCLSVAYAPNLRHWPFAGADGVRRLEVNGNASANTAEALLQLALVDLGIIRLSDVIVGEAIREGKLVPLLQDVHHREPVPLHAVYPQGRHRSPKVAAMVEFLVERFASAPWRTPIRKKR
jgi:DNA-binding transcriptional LysR family regulator